MIDDTATKEAQDEARNHGGLLWFVLLSPSATFDKSTASFIVNGRRVTLTAIREEIDKLEKRSGRKLIRISRKLIDGRITVQEWKDEMRGTLTTSHLLAAAVAAGSLQAAAASLTLLAKLTNELNYLDKFASDIERGRVSDARLAARAQSYAMGIRTTYAQEELNAKRKAEKKTDALDVVLPLTAAAVILAAGRGTYKEARRVRTARESCSECIAAAGEWMPIDDIPPLGSLRCGSRCRCFLEYR